MLKTNFVTMKEALKIAEERGIALGAFEFWSYEVARAIVQAAEELDVPVILQCGGLEINRMGGFEKLWNQRIWLRKTAPFRWRSIWIMQQPLRTATQRSMPDLLPL